MQITATAVFIKPLKISKKKKFSGSQKSQSDFLGDRKVLLEKRRDDEDNYAGLWALPGGHKRKKESIKQTLKREMKEELHIHIKEALPLGMFPDIDPTSKQCYHHHAFLCTTWHDHITKTTEEERVKWFNLKKLPSTIRTVDKKILRKVK